MLKPRDDFYSSAHPTPADVLVIIEVSDTWVEFDCGIKLPLYARAEIPQVVIVNIPGEVIENYTEPVNGAYQKFTRVQRDESVHIVGIPDLSLAVGSVLD